MQLKATRFKPFVEPCLHTTRIEGVSIGGRGRIGEAYMPRFDDIVVPG